jgi:hypothetical protein
LDNFVSKKEIEKENSKARKSVLSKKSNISIQKYAA